MHIPKITKKPKTPRVQVREADEDSDRKIMITHCNNGYQATTLAYITDNDALEIIEGLVRILKTRE